MSSCQNCEPNPFIQSTFRKKHSLFIKKREEVSQRIDKLNYWLLFASENRVKLPQNFNGLVLKHGVVGRIPYNCMSLQELQYLSQLLKQNTVLLLEVVLQKTTVNYSKVALKLKKTNPRLGEKIDAFSISYLHSLETLQESPEVEYHTELHDFTYLATQEIRAMIDVYNRISALICLDKL